jgi:MoaA/NifB/PqqE/SkfB family radical SAM enzyme
MSKIRIVNWLLTRRCNLKCDYCAIVKNYDGKPTEYPDMQHYIKNEMSTEQVLHGLSLIKKHNPDAFHILYGGEPLLRKDLATIINYCNDEDIHYTIISNNTDQIKPLIEKLIEDVHGNIKGFTASVDPVLFATEDVDEDSVIKSLAGFENLKKMKEVCDDVVAEITVMKHNQQYLYKLVQLLTEAGINSDITFIDTAKNPYYDFSNISDPDLLVGQSPGLAEQFQLISDNDVDVHMKHILMPEIWGILPSDMDCEIDKNLHNISIDADGTVRLCLRIRGTLTPKLVSLETLFNEDGDVHPIARSIIASDKRKHCKLCNHTCHLMSKYIDEHDLGPEDLVHLDRRK